MSALIIWGAMIAVVGDDGDGGERRRVLWIRRVAIFAKLTLACLPSLDL